MFPWLEILFCIQLSKITSGVSQIGLPTQRNTLYINEQYYSTLEAEIKAFDLFYINTGIKTKMCDEKGYTYYPFSVSNRIETGIHIKDTIKIGFRHTCIHPEVPWDYEVSHALFNASYDEIFIKAEFRLK